MLCQTLQNDGEAIWAGLEGNGDLPMQLSSTWSEPASFAALCAAMNYTWSPLRHLTAVSSGAYTHSQSCCSLGPCMLCMLIKMGVHVITVVQ